MRRSDRRTCEPVHSAICKKYHGAARCGVHRSAVPLVYSINELRLYLFSTRKTTAQHAHRSGGRRLDLASLDRSRAYLYLLTAISSFPTGRSSLERVAPYRAYADAAVRRGGVCVRMWSVVGGQKISQTPFSYRECR